MQIFSYACVPVRICYTSSGPLEVSEAGWCHAIADIWSQVPQQLSNGKQLLVGNNITKNTWGSWQFKPVVNSHSKWASNADRPRWQVTVAFEKLPFFLVVFVIEALENFCKLEVASRFLPNDTAFHSVTWITNLGITADSPPSRRNYRFLRHPHLVLHSPINLNSKVSLKSFHPTLVMNVAWGPGHLGWTQLCLLVTMSLPQSMGVLRFPNHVCTELVTLLAPDRRSLPIL